MSTPAESGPATEPHRIRVGHPEELIAAIPYLLRFTPTDSLVVIVVQDRGHGARIDACVRFDLTMVRDRPEKSVVELARRFTVRPMEALFLVYTEDDLPPHWEGRLTTAAAGSGIQPVGSWQVGQERYRELGPGRPQWRPLTSAGARVAAEFVLQGSAPAESRPQLLPDLTPAPEPVLAAVHRVCTATRTADTGVRLRAVTVWHRALARREPLGPAHCGLVHAGLASVLLRDALLASCLGVDEAGVLRAATGRQAAADLFDRLFAPGCPPPDAARIAAAGALLAELVRCAPPGRAAEPLSVLAWCAWWTGDGASANQYLELVLEQDPRHRLGLLLAAALDHGLRPGWVPR